MLTASPLPGKTSTILRRNVVLAYSCDDGEPAVTKEQSKIQSSYSSEKRWVSSHCSSEGKQVLGKSVRVLVL